MRTVADNHGVVHEWLEYVSSMNLGYTRCNLMPCVVLSQACDAADAKVTCLNCIADDYHDRYDALEDRY